MWTQLSKAIGLRRPEWGDWHTPDDAQSERYHALAEMQRTFAPTAPLLDLGCGMGRLLAELPAGLPYLGIDIQPEPARMAQTKCRTHQRIVCGDVRNHARHKGFEFGCVVFSEVLYYQPTTKAAMALLEDYEGLIEAPAIFLISIWLDHMKVMPKNADVLAHVRERYAGRFCAEHHIAASKYSGWDVLGVRLH